MGDFLTHLGPEGILAMGVLFLMLNFARGIVQMYFDRKDRGRIVEAASCNYPADLVQPLRSAVLQQNVIAVQQRDAVSHLESVVVRLAEAMERQTEKLIEALAELRAERNVRRER